MIFGGYKTEHRHLVRFELYVHGEIPCALVRLDVAKTRKWRLRVGRGNKARKMMDNRLLVRGSGGCSILMKLRA